MYTALMRRLLAAWLLVLIGLPFVSPLLASTMDADSVVPLCCRRNGAHHCLSAMRHGAASQGVEVSAKPQCCGQFPSSIAPSHSGDLFLIAPTPAFAEDVSLPSPAWQAEARARVALDRARHKRGPPTVRPS